MAKIHPVRKLQILALIPIAGLFSCQYNDYSNPVVNHPIDSKIIVELREILDEEPGNITLFAKTDSVYPCYNYKIQIRSELMDDLFKVTFTGLQFERICLDALGPARGSVDFGELPNGEYWIELNNAHLKNKGLLVINETEIKLLFAQLNGIEIFRTNLKRVPPRTYWGTIGYHKETSITLVNQFIQKLADRGAVFNKQIPGDYGYYKINADGEILDRDNHGYYFIESVIFQFTSDENALKELIRTGGGIDESQLSIRINSFKGEQFGN